MMPSKEHFNISSIFGCSSVTDSKDESTTMMLLEAVALVSRMVAPFKALVIMEKDASLRLVSLVGTTRKFNSIKKDPSFP